MTGTRRIDLGRCSGVTLCDFALGRADAEELAVEGSPLGANVLRVAQALEYLGAPFDSKLSSALETVASGRDAVTLQKLLDPLALATIDINPELRVKAKRGAAKAKVQERFVGPRLWKNHRRFISERERPAAKEAYDRAIARDREIAKDGER